LQAAAQGAQLDWLILMAVIAGLKLVGTLDRQLSIVNCETAR